MNNCVLFAIVFENNILLQLRDNFNYIQNPGCWAITGGAVEENETIEQALRRELSEEILGSDLLKEHSIINCGIFIGDNDVIENVFAIPVLDTNYSCIEGQDSKFFSFKNLPINIPKHHKKAIELIKLHCKISEVIKMSNVRDYVTVSKLGTDKDITALENGKGYMVYKNELLTVLYHNGEGMRFLGYIEFNNVKTRGDHYHKEKFENMCVISGNIKAKYKLLDNPDDVYELILTPGDIVHIKPGCAHSYLSDENGAIALEFSPQEFTKTDTIDIDFEW